MHKRVLRLLPCLCNVFCWFFREITYIVHKLNKITWKWFSSSFKNYASEHLRFTQLGINALFSTPILHLPLLHHPPSLDTDASNCQIDSVLFQANEQNTSVPIRCFSPYFLQRNKLLDKGNNACNGLGRSSSPLIFSVKTFKISTAHNSLFWVFDVKKIFCFTAMVPALSQTRLWCSL